MGWGVARVNMISCAAITPSQMSLRGKKSGESTKVSSNVQNEEAVELSVSKVLN